MAQIKNTSELRSFLCKSINMVANGTMETEKARNITKMAAQINESMYAEVKVARTQRELGQESAKFGELALATDS